VRLASEDAEGAVDYVVEMRRYHERSTLAQRLATGSAGEPEVRAVVRRLAEFHAKARQPSPPERAVAALAAMLTETGDRPRPRPRVPRHGSPAPRARLATALATAYREAGGDPGDDAMFAFFVA
jgi:hypothetical protein